MQIEQGIRSSDWNEIRATAYAAEAHGFDGLVTFELNNDPFISLALAAMSTDTVRLGTAIAVCFPRSPMIVAQSAWDLHSQSGGRFTLGLGTQVKGHNERRFSIPWSPPQPRLREYIESLRAIWRCWEIGEKLNYEGEHYQFSLMTPEFSPSPSGIAPIPITIAAVRPAMMRLSGQVCDGVRLHPFATRRYIEEIALPEIGKGLTQSGKDRSNFEIWGGGFIVTGKDEEAIVREREAVRYRIAFYGSTRTYLPVLELHDWQDLGAKLHRMSKNGQWSKMAAEISDDVLDEFSVIATYDELVPKLRDRYAGQTDTIALDLVDTSNTGQIMELIEGVKNIDCPFQGFSSTW